MSPRKLIWDVTNRLNSGESHQTLYSDANKVFTEILPRIASGDESRELADITVADIKAVTAALDNAADLLIDENKRIEEETRRLQEETFVIRATTKLIDLVSSLLR